VGQNSGRHDEYSQHLMTFFDLYAVSTRKFFKTEKKTSSSLADLINTEVLKIVLISVA
jgi:hypothetical protein